MLIDGVLFRESEPFLDTTFCQKINEFLIFLFKILDSSLTFLIYSVFEATYFGVELFAHNTHLRLNAVLNSLVHSLVAEQVSCLFAR